MSQSNMAIQAFRDAGCAELTAGMLKIRHAVRQLSADQVWWRPQPSMNSIANLLLHLTGNLQQWLVAGLSEEPDTRQRQVEFDERSGKPPEMLLDELESAVGQAVRCIGQLPDADVTRVRRVQEFDVNAAEAMWDSISHFKGHVQEIVHIARVQLGDSYQFDFVPNA